MVATQQTFSEQTRWTGNGLTWDDWMFPAIIVNLPAISDPRYAKWLDDGAGSAGVWAWLFDSGDVAPLIPQQLPHRYALGTTIQPHIHFSWTVTPAVGATVQWDVEVSFAPINGTHPATTTHLTGTYVATAADVARRHVICPLTPNIVGASLGISAMAHVTVKHAGGTHASEVVLGGFDFHFQSDALGSDQATSKG